MLAFTYALHYNESERGLLWKVILNSYMPQVLVAPAAFFVFIVSISYFDFKNKCLFTVYL